MVSDEVKLGIRNTMRDVDMPGNPCKHAQWPEKGVYIGGSVDRFVNAPVFFNVSPIPIQE